MSTLATFKDVHCPERIVSVKATPHTQDLKYERFPLDSLKLGSSEGIMMGFGCSYTAGCTHVFMELAGERHFERVGEERTAETARKGPHLLRDADYTSQPSQARLCASRLEIREHFLCSGQGWYPPPQARWPGSACCNSSYKCRDLAYNRFGNHSPSFVAKSTDVAYFAEDDVESICVHSLIWCLSRPTLDDHRKHVLDGMKNAGQCRDKSGKTERTKAVEDTIEKVKSWAQLSVTWH